MSTFFQLSVLLTALLAVAVNAGLHCSKAQGPRYGYISSGKKDSYRAGSVVIFKCNRRYKLSGQAMTKCVAKGNSAYWNSRVPICRKQTTVTVRKRCSNPIAPSYGYISAGKKQTYGVGSAVIFKCNRGYQLSGRGTIKCVSNQYKTYWNSKAPICKKQFIKVCGKLQDPQYGDVSQSGITIGSKAKYTCNRGFKLRGNSVRKCQNNGRWSGSKPSCQRVTVVTCKRLSDPRDGDVRMSGLKIGSKATYSCDRGHKLRGNQVRKCQTNGQWSGSVPTCKKIVVNCPRINDPRNGDVRVSGLRVGSKATYSCDRGHKLRGNQIRKCQSNGQWSGSDPSCIKVVNCPKLNDPRNGDVRVSGLRVGSKATYSCDRGHKLRGNQIRKCQSNGQWSGSDPICQKTVTCDKLSDPRNGDVVITGVAVGSMATYTCDNGFELIGEQSRTCQPNGRWTDKDPICKEVIVFCDQLFDPANGNVDLTGVTEGSTATYTCDQRFEIIFGDKLRTCQSDGQWSGDEPICEEIIITCDQLFDPANGKVQLISLDEGSTATYTCDEGFDFTGGDKFRTCQSDGQWSGQEPICEEIIITCDQLFDPTNGNVELTGVTEGSTATYTCENGFDLTGGDDFRICQPDGQWSGQEPICEEKIILCDILTDPVNGIVDLDGVLEGSTAKYICVPGFELVGDKFRTCESTGQWSGNEPICEEIIITCDQLFDPDNGNVDLSDDINEGSTATYTCDRGFELRGDELRTCESSGQWSGDEPICEEITCEQLIDPDNGIVDLTGINVGSRATYSCDKGFDLTGGQFIRTCQPNGQWSGDAPSCEKIIINCEQLFDPKEGNIEVTGTTVGSTASYTCDQGFFLTNGDSVRQCQPNGQWSGNEPTCEVIPIKQCKYLSNPKYGFVHVTTGVQVGSVASYICQKGYILKGLPYLTCQYNGQWTGQPPVCVAYKGDY